MGSGKVSVVEVKNGFPVPGSRENLTMKLRRQGSRRNLGWNDMFDSNRPNDKPTLRWDAKENTLTLRLLDVRDPTSTSYHDYEIILHIEDITRILDFLSQEPLRKSGRALSEGLIASSHPLFRLMLSSLISDFETLRDQVATLKAEQVALQRKVKSLESDVAKLESDKA
jgi:hypothetical protein